jgi:hypothetical protein
MMEAVGSSETLVYSQIPHSATTHKTIVHSHVTVKACFMWLTTVSFLEHVNFCLHEAYKPWQSKHAHILINIRQYDIA